MAVKINNYNILKFTTWYKLLFTLLKNLKSLCHSWTEILEKFSLKTSVLEVEIVQLLNNMPGYFLKLWNADILADEVE
jgi:hypothetical protein